MVATWDIRSGNSDLDKSPCGGRGGASKIRRYHSALTHLQLAHFPEGAISSVSRLLISIRQLVFFCLHRLQRCFLRWTKPPQASLLLGMAVDLAGGKSELVAENALLRQQLIMVRLFVRATRCCTIRCCRMRRIYSGAMDGDSKRCQAATNASALSSVKVPRMKRSGRTTTKRSWHLLSKSGSVEWTTTSGNGCKLCGSFCSR